MSRNYYGKLIKEYETPTRMSGDDRPYNFEVVAFTSKKLRSDACDYASEYGYNVISTYRNELYSCDFAIEGYKEDIGFYYEGPPVFKTLEEFIEYTIDRRIIFR